MKKVLYIILTAIAVLYFIAYPTTIGVWYLASQIWKVPAPTGFGQQTWLNLVLVNIILFGGLARLSPFLVSKETQETALYRWMEYVVHMIAFLSLAFLLLGMGITSPKPNSLLPMIVGMFVAFAILIWGISRPLQIIGYLPEKWITKWLLGEDVFPHERKRALEIIETPRLRLMALKREHLYLYRYNPAALEEKLGIRLSRDIMTEAVIRALEMKIEKMAAVNVKEHVWFTYWLIVTKDDLFGVGMVGFKGTPNVYNATEIGYGIDPAYQNRGYMTEAVKALVDWAFNYPYCYCQVVTATDVTNLASRRLLEKLGAKLVLENEQSTSWEFVNERKNYSL